jgi:hypothetical protein
MRQHDVRHIGGDQFRFLKPLVEDGTVEATITLRRLKPFLPDLPIAGGEPPLRGSHSMREFLRNGHRLGYIDRGSDQYIAWTVDGYLLGYFNQYGVRLSRLCSMIEISPANSPGRISSADGATRRKVACGIWRSTTTAP